MKKLLLILLAVLCAGVAGRFLYRSAEDEMNWRTDKAVQLSVLRQAEQHLIQAKIFQGFPTEEEDNTLATIIVKDLRQSAEDEVIDAKQALLRLYKDRGRSLSAEEAAQASQWKQDVAAWEAKEAESIRH